MVALGNTPTVSGAGESKNCIEDSVGLGSATIYCCTGMIRIRDSQPKGRNR